MKKSYLLSSIIASVTLYSCSNGSNSSTNTFTPVPLKWEACNPLEYNGITEVMINTLGNRLSCAKMVAPADYSNPSLGNIEVALSKVSAEIPSERQGSIFFNPGGPGINGIGDAPIAGILWSDADEQNPLGAKLKQLSNRYDLIGFSPRGVSSSTALVCQQSGKVQYPLNFNESLTSINNQKSLYMNAEVTAKVCQTNKLTPFINTDATARDMDLARSLLGDAKLSYIGYSYGTWLGTWYAGLFPNHVDKMVIDSNMDITISNVENIFSQPEALQNITDNIIAPYANLNESIFQLGTTQDVQNIYPQLNNTMKLVLRYTLYSPLFSQSMANDTVEILSAAKTVNKLIIDNPYDNESSILNMVKIYSFSPDNEINDATILTAEKMVNMYFYFIQQQPIPVYSSTNTAVRCNDGPAPTSFAEWLAIINNISVNGAIFSTTLMQLNCTTYWNGPTVTQPSINSMSNSSYPILMVQTQYDGATPLQGALNTYNALGTASMVYVTNSYNHGVFNIIENGCAENAVADYLLTGALPENQLLICQGKGLLPNVNKINVANKNQESLSTNLANKAIYGKEISMAKTFKHPEKAQKIREQIQKNIINAELTNQQK
ncbi:MAG: alpha/beta fold hydrolase [Burkholderiales bacterium]|nr:alpha/beta fold hydrolase [Burkholderiales bacterium]